jgi:phosphopantetheinyl transferase
LFIHDLEGHVRERWTGLHLRGVGKTALPACWPSALLSAYLERRLAELIPLAQIAVQISNCACDKDSTTLAHRPDGKPVDPQNSDVHLSRSHCAGLTLAVRSRQPVGCDMEQIVTRGEDAWGRLVGPQWLAFASTLAQRTRTSLDAAATHAWTLKEALRKSGAGSDQPLQFESHTNDGWSVSSSGHFRAAIFKTRIKGLEHELAFCFVGKKQP